MRVILSNVTEEQSKLKIEFELVNPSYANEDATVTLIEKESLASITVPVPAQNVNGNTATITIDPTKFHLDLIGQDEFQWQLYYSCGNTEHRALIQVEGEYVSAVHRIGFKAYYQYDIDPSGMAVFYVRTNRTAKQFVMNSANLFGNGKLRLTGFDQINDQKLNKMAIILRKASDQSEQTYPVHKRPFKGIFEITIPLEQLDDEDTYRLYIEYDCQEKHLRQRLVMDTSLSSFRTIAKLANHHELVLKEGHKGQLRVVARKQPDASKQIAKFRHKLTHLWKSFKILAGKVNRLRLRKLFKRGHTPFATTTIVFESFGGRQVSDSPYAIYQVFKKLYPKLNFVWSIQKSQKQFCKDHNINYVIKNTGRWVRIMGKAKVWISNARFPAWVIKPDYVTYVQTWHGTPLKKLGLDIERVSMPGTTTNKYHDNFVKEANRWDALISPNDFSTKVFRSAFGYKNQILKVGYPRNDELINDNYPTEINKIKDKLGIPRNKKVVLYAPTYRDNQFESKGKYTFKLPFSLDEFKQRFGEDTVLILRMHYLISNVLDVSDYHGYVYDLSNYSNISDLYLISDLLITDYSSVFFDYAYLKRPILFYPYDYHTYKDELRGFYLNYERDLPGEIVYDPEQLMNGIESALKNDDVEHDPKFMDFYNRFCRINDGLSSIKVVDYVMQQIR